MGNGVRPHAGRGGSNGRDHHPFGFSVWMAGGGIKAGIVHGATDEIGFHAVENRHYVTDIHATVLHQLGIDPETAGRAGTQAARNRLRETDSRHPCLACCRPCGQLRRCSISHSSMTHKSVLTEKMYAYVQQGKVYQAPFDSGPAKQIHDGRRPRWSPDSKLLAFTANHDGVAQIFLCDAFSGNTRQLTHSRSPVTSFAWSADSRAIGFLAMDAGPPPDPVVSGKYSQYSRLYLQAIDANSAKRITEAQVHVTSFALSPSGRHAVYAAQATPLTQDSLQSDLYTVDLATLVTKPLCRPTGPRRRSIVLSRWQVDRISLAGRNNQLL